MGILLVDLACFCALPEANQILLLEDLLATEECEWDLKVILYRRSHTNPVPGPLEPLRRGF